MRNRKNADLVNKGVNKQAKKLTSVEKSKTTFPDEHAKQAHVNCAYAQF